MVTLPFRALLFGGPQKRTDGAMKNLKAKACFALSLLAVVMGLLLFVPAGTVHYWQAWVFLSIFTGASVLTTLYLLRKDRALLERRMSATTYPSSKGASSLIPSCLPRSRHTNYEEGTEDGVP